MALKKMLVFGTKQGDYLKIVGCHSNTLYSSTIVRIAVYENKESRDKDVSSYFKIIDSVVNKIDITRAEAYVALKEKGQFEDAEDC